MSRRRILDLNRKRSALLRCDDISAALKSLALEVLNTHARIADTDHALRLAASVERLKDRIWKYPAERRKAEAEANRKRAAAASQQENRGNRYTAAKKVEAPPQVEATPLFEAPPGNTSRPRQRDYAKVNEKRSSAAMAQQVGAIGDILESASEMPSSLKNDPAGLLRLGAQALCDPDASRDDLHRALFAALAFVGARHHQRIENQLREATKAMRARMN